MYLNLVFDSRFERNLFINFNPKYSSLILNNLLENIFNNAFITFLSNRGTLKGYIE